MMHPKSLVCSDICKVCNRNMAAFLKSSCHVVFPAFFWNSVCILGLINNYTLYFQVSGGLRYQTGLGSCVAACIDIENRLGLRQWSLLPINSPVKVKRNINDNKLFQCMFVTFLYINCVMVRKDLVVIAGITPFSLVVNSWQAALPPAHTAKHKVKSGVQDQWKEPFMDSADWCIPVGPAHLLVWRERFDSGVIVRTIPLPIVFNQPSVLPGIS